MAIIFLDLETTGFDPWHDRILELAAARVDTQLNPVSGFTVLIKPMPGVSLVMDEYVRNMHTQNGLLAELAGPSAVLPIDVEQPFNAWLNEQGPGPHTLAGDSVHFDLSFLRVHLPVCAGLFSHRLLDVSAFRVARSIGGLPECPIDGGGHRAQTDVLASIAKARWHLSRLAA
jgi:oligoribonuclease